MVDDPTPPGDDDSVDLEELIGNVLESRGFTVERASKLDALDSLGDNLGKKVEELFRASNSGGNSGNPTPFDPDSFLAKVGEMVDAKLAGITPGTTVVTEKKPILRRWLGA